MPLIGSITSALSSLSMPPGVQSALSLISKEGPASVLPIEGAVITGRSAEAAKRSGFLEFQERFPEEVSVAIVWLFGVNSLKRQFNKFKGKFFPKLQHLDLDIAYKNKIARQFQTVGTTAQEGYLKNALESKAWTKLKGAQLAFSVGVAMTLCAAVIPWLNKKKTDWYIEKVHKPRHRAKQAKLRAEKLLHHKNAAAAATPNLAQPGTPAQTTPQFTSPIGTSLNAAPQLFPGGVPMALSSPSPQQFGGVQNAPKFAGLGGIIQGLGHLVEQTPYGSILVVDTGITGGRMVSYGKRNPFESVEVGLRDGLSLYLYILAVPHLMKLASMGIDPALKTTMLFRPAAAEAVNKAIMNSIHSGTGNVSANTIRALVNGSDHDALKLADGWVKNAMRTAPAVTSGERTGFLNLLRDEVANYSADAKAAKGNLENIRKYLTGRLGENYAARMTVDDMDDLIRAIQTGQGPFEKIADKTARADLVTAVKQSFQHTAGIDINFANIEKSLLADKHSPFAQILKALPKEERTALLARVQKMAQLDAQETANSMLRRYLVLSRNATTTDSAKALISSAEDVATWLEKAANRRVPLNELVEQELKSLGADIAKVSAKKGVSESHVEKLVANRAWDELQRLASAKEQSLLGKLGRALHLTSGATLPERIGSLQKYFAAADTAGQHPVESLLGKIESQLGGKTSAATTNALAHYKAEITKLLSGNQGRITSLHVSDAVEILNGKIHELMRGGLKHDSSLFKQTLAATNELVEDSRLYSNPKKVAAAKQLFEKYLDRIMLNAEEAAGKNGGKLGRTAIEKLMSLQTKLNQNTHMFTRVAALGTAMLAIGWGVPKIQYAITKKLTGKNEHPTFAALNAEENAEDEAAASLDLYNGPPLNRQNAFQMFSR